MAPTLVIGLTGGIASGKSTVARMFQALGVPIVDADEAARAVVVPGAPALEAIREAFGDAVIGADGELDRARLRQLVFDDSGRRRQLESILHPRIRAWMHERTAELEASYVIHVVPLLVETGQHRAVDRVLVVDVDPQLQVDRAVARDATSRALVTRIMAAQAGRETRLAAADDVIRNDGSEDALRVQVERLHRAYLAMAARLRADRQQ